MELVEVDAIADPLLPRPRNAVLVFAPQPRTLAAELPSKFRTGVAFIAAANRDPFEPPAATAFEPVEPWEYPTVDNKKNAIAQNRIAEIDFTDHLLSWFDISPTNSTSGKILESEPRTTQ